MRSAVAILAACAAVAASLPAVADRGGHSCRLDVAHRADGMVTVRAFAHGAAETEGLYELRLQSDGAAGRSTVTQGGAYVLSADGTSTLSRNELTLAPSGRLAAELTVHSRAGTDRCVERWGAGS